jgi:hypothetical protein
MAILRLRRAARWIYHHLLWDATDGASSRFYEVIWATRKIILVAAGTALLTWLEWVEHHPPAIAIITLIHFVFVFVAVGLLVYFARCFKYIRHVRK